MKAVNSMQGEKILSLRHAILIYSADAQFSEAAKSLQFVATLHAVDEAKGRPVIGAGTCVSAAQAEAFALAISRSAMQRTFLPENVLLHSANLTIWWQPSCVRRIFFVKKKAKDFSAFNAKRFRHPALCFVLKDRTLRVFALAENQRPTPKTKLYRAPYPNVTNEGAIQLCGCTPPPDTSIASLPAWEANFYDSAFSHLANVGKLTKFKGGILALYELLTCASMLDDQPHYLSQNATAILLPTKRTLADLAQ